MTLSRSLRMLLQAKAAANVALSILSTIAPRDLVSAIAPGDRAGLSRAPGVGGRSG